MKDTTPFLIGIPIIIGIGQILFKQSSRSLRNVDFLTAATLLVDPWFITALVLYGSSTVAWVYVIRDVPIGRAYLFMALTFMVVPLGGWFCFGEPITLRIALGIVIIITGIVVATT